MQVQTWEFLVGHRELGLLKMENDGEVYVLHYGPAETSLLSDTRTPFKLNQGRFLTFLGMRV